MRGKKTSNGYDLFREACENSGDELADALLTVVAEVLNGGFEQALDNCPEQMKAILNLHPYGPYTELFLTLDRQALAMQEDFNELMQQQDDIEYENNPVINALNELDNKFYSWSDEFYSEVVATLTFKITDEDKDLLKGMGIKGRAKTNAVEKDAKILVTRSTIARGVAEANALLEHLDEGLKVMTEGEGSEDVMPSFLLDEVEEILEIKGRLESLLAATPEDLQADFGSTSLEELLDDTNPSGFAQIVQGDLKRIAEIRMQYAEAGFENLMDPSVRTSMKEADFLGDTVRDTVKYLRMNKEKLKQLLQTSGKGEPAVMQELQKLPVGTQKPNALTSLVTQWLNQAVTDVDLTQGVERLVQKRGSAKTAGAVDEVGKFWVVTQPTENSTLADVVFGATIERMMLQALGGLRYNEILGIYRDREVAIQEGRKLVPNDKYPDSFVASTDDSIVSVNSITASKKAAQTTSRDVRRAIKFLGELIAMHREQYFNFKKVVVAVNSSAISRQTAEKIFEAMTYMEETKRNLEKQLREVEQEEQAMEAFEKTSPGEVAKSSAPKKAAPAKPYYVIKFIKGGEATYFNADAPRRAWEKPSLATKYENASEPRGLVMGTMMGTHDFSQYQKALDYLGGPASVEARVVKVNPKSGAAEKITKCVDCGKSLPVGKMVKNSEGAGYLCHECEAIREKEDKAKEGAASKKAASAWKYNVYPMQIEGERKPLGTIEVQNPETLSDADYDAIVLKQLQPWLPENAHDVKMSWAAGATIGNAYIPNSGGAPERVLYLEVPTSSDEQEKEMADETKNPHITAGVGEHDDTGLGETGSTTSMPVSFICRTDGKGLWSSTATKVQVTELELYTIYYDGDPIYELKAYFNKVNWDTNKLGLIYTDATWMRDFKQNLKQLGLGTDVTYSEQGMQGDDYVSLDVGPKFLRSWQRINKTNEPLPEITDEDKDLLKGMGIKGGFHARC
jgi:hypothetical protein